MMEIANTRENNIMLSTKNRPNAETPSLDELISGIDRQLEELLGPEIGREAAAREWKSEGARLQNQYIRVTMGTTIFALPLKSALEIGQRPNITPLPNLPGWVLGISNVRGEIISFVDLKAFLGIPSLETRVENRFVIIHNQDLKIGIIVDQILGIKSIDRIDSDIQSSPYREGEVSKYISGVAFSGEQLLNILAIDKLLSSPRLTDFEAT